MKMNEMSERISFPPQNITTNKCPHLSVDAQPAKFENGPMIKVLNHILSTEGMELCYFFTCHYRTKNRV